MKRHPSLAPLSREHHGALILARLLQKNAPEYKDLPSDTAGKAIYALKFYNEEIIKHFEEEEKILKLVIGINSSLDILAGNIFKEHQDLKVLFHSINIPAGSADHLNKLGKALEIHIRKEERELFPMIQEICNEEIMAEIENSLSSKK